MNVPTVETLQAAISELEGFLEQAKQTRAKKLLRGNISHLQEELMELQDQQGDDNEEKKRAEAEAEAEAEAARAAEEAKAARAVEEAKAARAAAEAKAAEKEKADEPKKKEGGPKKPAAVSGEAAVTPGGMSITEEAARVMQKMKTGLGRNHKDTAAVMKIGSNGKTFEFEELMEDASIEDIAEEMTELDPRYIFYSYNKVMPDGRLKTPLVFIFYSPQKAPPKKAMEYSRWLTEVAKYFEVVKTLQIRDLDDFTQEWFDTVN